MREEQQLISPFRDQENHESLDFQHGYLDISGIYLDVSLDISGCHEEKWWYSG